MRIKLPLSVGVVMIGSMLAPNLLAQVPIQYSRLNSFSLFSEYSHTSSHIEWGVSRKRQFVNTGVEYARRFNAPHWFNWTPHASVFYEMGVLPAAFLQDQVATDVILNTNVVNATTSPIYNICVPGVFTVPQPGNQGYTFSRSCGTRWTYMGGASPAGFRVNFAPKKKVQPLIDSHLGFLVSNRDIPVNNSSSFNFTFEFGAGVELFENHNRSLAIEYRLHHLSNAYLGYDNPGVDSQALAVTFRFGRSLN
ncbi:acyloxyacyl hydrolase [Granulicella sp. WH15]|uniref:acyloxyacyl hydrolase n=1 Tax=Granulicella sp. WH15 TaxID=2602070 RepID=UPI0013A59135|nr:acyloxyacyl hydrolase [Granulicella sp. WH15]